MKKLPGVVSVNVLTKSAAEGSAEVVFIVSHRIHSYGFPPPRNGINLTILDEDGKCLRRDSATPFSRSDNAWLEHRLRSGLRLGCPGFKIGREASSGK